ncbi:MAG: endonuclease/exonuclease/phosphatase family protein [Oscillospiraceae bacterium]
MKKLTRRIGICLLTATAALGSYVAYVSLQYHRIPDKTALTPLQEGENRPLQRGRDYRAVTYNLGFGAYSPDYTFFMDTGVMADGTPTAGRYGRARSAQSAAENTDGSTALLQAQDADFYLLQEVDRDATRSFHINQAAQLAGAFPAYEAVYAQNFHSAYLAYPLTDMHGKTDAGLLTLSRFSSGERVRRSYPVDPGFPQKFFDLDRCFAVQRYPIEGGGQLVLINSHMSAYDAGGTIRAKQLELLRTVLIEERDAGNLVLVGGDFNHALGGTKTAFPSGQQVPAWVAELADADLPSGYRLVRAENLFAVGTCRGSDIPYEKGVTYETVVDGFLASDGLTVSARNLDGGYRYSDHNPVELTFQID